MKPVAVGRPYKVANPVDDPQRLKARLVLVTQPLNLLSEKNWFQSLLFQMGQLVRYTLWKICRWLREV
jgi:hypothetical protein